MLMKKAIIAASAAIILAAGAAAFWTVFGGNEDEFFNENLEALMSGEGVSAVINCAGEGRIYCPLTNTSEFKEVTYSQL